MEVKLGYKQTEVGIIPDEWEVGTASDACELVVDCKNRTPPVVAESDFAVVRTPNVRNGQFVLDDLRFTDEDSYRVWTARAVPQLGDIMITREAPLGEVCAVPASRKVCLGQRMMLYRPSPERTFSTYLLYSLMSEPVRENLFRKIGGSTVGHAKVDDIRFLQLPLPPLPEQRAIASALSDVDGLLGGLGRLISKKRDLKQAAMQQLLTGQTRLPGFHGEWEVRRLGELIERLPKTTRPSSSGKAEGAYPFFTNSTKPVDRFLDEADFDAEAIIANTGGEAYFNYCRGKFAAMADCFVFKASVVTRFLYYVLKSIERTVNDNGFTGSGIKHLDKKYFYLLEVRCPAERPEQTAIAEVLMEMDCELALLEQRRDKTRALKQAMMQELLTGRTRLV